MTSKEFLESNKKLLIGAVGTKINLLEQKVRRETKIGQTERIAGRQTKIKELAILMDWLENGTFED